MNWSNPRRTFESVVDELAEGLGNGTIALSEREEKPPLENKEELLKLQPLPAEGPREQFEPPRRLTATPAPTDEPAIIGKGLFIKGEISGSESLFIDGKVEGSINLRGNRVTVGRDGQVAASIIAREVVVLGKVRGNVTASDRVDIRAEGVLSGDVAAARISIEDGAFFKGGIAIHKPGSSEDKPHVGLSAWARVEEEKLV